jgi:hypothetical protein
MLVHGEVGVPQEYQQPQRNQSNAGALRGLGGSGAADHR